MPFHLQVLRFFEGYESTLAPYIKERGLDWEVMKKFNFQKKSNYFSDCRTRVRRKFVDPEWPDSTVARQQGRKGVGPLEQGCAIQPSGQCALAI
jgi:hypothetical protein